MIVVKNIIIVVILERFIYIFTVFLSCVQFGYSKETG